MAFRSRAERDGTYRILADNGPTGDHVSEPFTVSGCAPGESCPQWEPDPNARAQITQAKIDAKDAYMAGCALSWIIKTAPGTIATYGVLSETGFAFPGGLAGTVGISLGAGITAAVVLPSVVPADFAVNAVADYFCAGRKAAIRDLDDPPDPNYQTVYQPVLRPVASAAIPLDPTVRALLAQLNQLQALSNARITSYERWSAAVADHADAQAALQAQAVSDYSEQLSLQTLAVADAIRTASTEFSTEGNNDSIILPDAATRTSLLAFHQRVIASGFSAPEVAILAGAGLTAAQIEEFRAEIAQDYSQSPVGVSRTDSLLLAADKFESASDGYDVASRWFAIKATAIPNLAPTASFTATPTSGEAPLAVAFGASSSADTDGSIVSYAWDFGDGATDTGMTATHTYTAAANRTATLTVTDDQGATATATRAITVAAPGSHTPPIAVVAATTPTVGVAPLAVSFTGVGSSDAQGPIASYAWDFGDGGTAAGPTPQHTFTGYGTYVVTLTVSDGDGEIASSTVIVTVGTLPVASFTRTPGGGRAASGCVLRCVVQLVVRGAAELCLAVR